MNSFVEPPHNVPLLFVPPTPVEIAAGRAEVDVRLTFGFDIRGLRSPSVESLGDAIGPRRMMA
jgi:hypothetical protein